MARALRYADLADDLRRRIASGELRPGRLLPSEAQLASENDVSRVTVRKALAQLRDAGLVASRSTACARSRRTCSPPARRRSAA